MQTLFYIFDHAHIEKVTTMKRYKPLILPALFILATLVLVSCARRPMGHEGDPAFIRGLIDGFLAPFSFCLSLFSDHIRMYAFPNIGRWYDFGFLLGVSSWGGGAAAAR